MNEWKIIETLADVPEPGTWDQFEWEQNTVGYWVEWDGANINIQKYGRITSLENRLLRYRPKPLPSDGWILARAWECSIQDTWHFVEAIEGNQVFMDNNMVLDREWFKAGRYRVMGKPQTGGWEG